MDTAPTHAYLLAGPRGVSDAHARRLAASIVAPDDPRGLELAMRGVHPDIVEFEPVARTYSVREDVRSRVLPEAHRSPVEGERKVILLREVERLADAAHALLKTLEEPPDRTHFLLVTDSPDELAETVRSRCRRIDVRRPTDHEVFEALVEGGLDARAASLAASIAGGELERARTLVGRLSGVRAAFLDAAYDLDGTGATVSRHSAAVQEAVRSAIAALEQQHAIELETLSEELADAGYPARTATAQRRRLEERHKREARRARTEAWLEGLAVLESAYRDALVPERPRNLDRDPLGVRPSDAASALDACRAAREAFEFNPNEGLLIERVLLSLPRAR